MNNRLTLEHIVTNRQMLLAELNPREILRRHSIREERAQAWARRTGKSERAFYRRLAEMQ